MQLSVHAGLRKRKLHVARLCFGLSCDSRVLISDMKFAANPHGHFGRAPVWVLLVGVLCRFVSGVRSGVR